jgi:hypothetical protein
MNLLLAVCLAVIASLGPTKASARSVVIFNISIDIPKDYVVALDKAMEKYPDTQCFQLVARRTKVPAGQVCATNNQMAIEDFGIVALESIPEHARTFDTTDNNAPPKFVAITGASKYAMNSSAAIPGRSTYSAKIDCDDDRADSIYRARSDCLLVYSPGGDQKSIAAIFPIQRSGSKTPPISEDTVLKILSSVRVLRTR